ncbi:uncharacterized protein B0I36DRAFT_101841 [Microdochium trichocladiopsis]|uniref:Uncharacterized protein n=1 Tax=Microdochium trichocladiopsis TaxID=1682393 RepID=A0A9P8Y8E1_9PEZI|nr:uncharacterized protein B0I36DRAFT_101841 [Microdochium trichocladiopsis]KAH7032883.1 hypothetical protein B0I36DRAFT_101841 [Microdochium trichocladiopsis]
MRLVKKDKLLLPSASPSTAPRPEMLQTDPARSKLIASLSSPMLGGKDSPIQTCTKPCTEKVHSPAPKSGTKIEIITPKGRTRTRNQSSFPKFDAAPFLDSEEIAESHRTPCNCQGLRSSPLLECPIDEARHLLLQVVRHKSFRPSLVLRLTTPYGLKQCCGAGL